MYAAFTGQPLETVQQYTERDRFLSASEVIMLLVNSNSFGAMVLRLKRELGLKPQATTHGHCLLFLTILLFHWCSFAGTWVWAYRWSTRNRILKQHIHDNAQRQFHYMFKAFITHLNMNLIVFVFLVLLSAPFIFALIQSENFCSIYVSLLWSNPVEEECIEPAATPEPRSSSSTSHPTLLLICSRALLH